MKTSPPCWDIFAKDSMRSWPKHFTNPSECKSEFQDSKQNAYFIDSGFSVNEVTMLEVNGIMQTIEDRDYTFFDSTNLQNYNYKLLYKSYTKWSCWNEVDP